MFTLDPAFVRPSYDENCFTALPASIGPLLGAPGAAASAGRIPSGPAAHLSRRGADPVGRLRLALLREGGGRLPCLASFRGCERRGKAHVSVSLHHGRGHHLPPHRAGGRAERRVRVAVLRAAARRRDHPAALLVRRDQGAGHAQADRHRAGADLSHGDPLPGAGEVRDSVVHHPARRVYPLDLLGCRVRRRDGARLPDAAGGAGQSAPAAGPAAQADLLRALPRPLRRAVPRVRAELAAGGGGAGHLPDGRSSGSSFRAWTGTGTRWCC